MSTASESPAEILARLYASVNDSLDIPRVSNITASENIEYLARCRVNRSGIRLLMSCMLAKVEYPHVDPREPYTEIGGGSCFSGRTYDERYITAFITDNNLPCNNTTAYLTPAFRNHSSPLVLGTELNGRPPEMYERLLDILDDVALGRLSSEAVLAETVRILCILRDDRKRRLEALLAEVNDGSADLLWSSEAILID